MKRTLFLLSCLSVFAMPALARANGCYESEVHLLSKVAVVDPFGDPVNGADGEPIGAPDRSSSEDCEGDTARLHRDAAPGATLLAVTESGHRPLRGALVHHGGVYGLAFGAAPDASGTWRSSWIGVGPGDAVTPGDDLLVSLCVEAPAPATIRCFDTHFYA